MSKRQQVEETSDFQLLETQQEGNAMRMQSEPQIVLNGFETYADAIRKFRQQISEAVKLGIMSEQTGAKIILEHEYSFYQQIVSVEYKLVE